VPRGADFLPGTLVGQWTILRRLPSQPLAGGAQRRWKVRCYCGNVVVRTTTALHVSQSCGCLARTVARQRLLTHGQSRIGSAIYRTWKHMLDRCRNPGAREYPYYGGRGIHVCKRWRVSFVAFREDMGPRLPGTSLDRIDNDGDYTPKNCRWATIAQQARNTRYNRRITHNGETLCLVDWARRIGISHSTLRWRLQHWSVARALAA